MIRLSVSDLDLETITEALDDPSVDDVSKRKLLTIRMHVLNVPHGNIAKILCISGATVTNYLNIYRDQGLVGLYDAMGMNTRLLKTCEKLLEVDPENALAQEKLPGKKSGARLKSLFKKKE